LVTLVPDREFIFSKIVQKPLKRNICQNRKN
jgi:hypothetical protein